MCSTPVLHPASALSSSTGLGQRPSLCLCDAGMMEPHLGWSLGTRVINVMKKKDAVPRSSIRPEPRANGATPRVDLAQQLPMGEDQPVGDWQRKSSHVSGCE